MTLLFLNGGGMRGGPLHHQLRGAPLVGVVRTAPRYRFWSVGDRFPALEATGAGGVSVVGELYDVSLETLRMSLLPAEPPELELGVVELADGASALATVLRRTLPPGTRLTDISHVADWRAYLATLAARDTPRPADLVGSTVAPEPIYRANEPRPAQPSGMGGPGGMPRPGGTGVGG